MLYILIIGTILSIIIIIYKDTIKYQWHYIIYRLRGKLLKIKTNKYEVLKKIKNIPTLKLFEHLLLVVNNVIKFITEININNNNIYKILKILEWIKNILNYIINYLIGKK